MPEPGYIIAAVLMSSAVTWALRAAPFAALAPLRHSALLPYLNENMPVGIMTILVFYTVRSVPPSLTPVTMAMTAGFSRHCCTAPLAPERGYQCPRWDRRPRHAGINPPQPVLVVRPPLASPAKTAPQRQY